MPSALLSFEKLHNTRDLGGLPAAGGRAIRPGRLIRSGHLAGLPEGDLRHLSSFADTVVDFRTDKEKARQPDCLPAGTAYHHIPVVSTLTPGITREEEADKDAVMTLLHKPQEARDYMCGLYAAFARSDYALSQYARFLRILLRPGKKAVLWHCTAGKDRAGIGAVLIEEILGVPRTEILADYLATNDFLADDVRFLNTFIKKKAGTDSPLADQSLHYLFGAREEFLQSFYLAAKERFGSLEALLEKGLGITEKDRESFRSLYLAQAGEHQGDRIARRQGGQAP